MPWHLYTIQRSDLLKTKESHFSFVWDMDFSIICPSLDEATVSTVNSDLTNYGDVQRLHENSK